MKKKIVDLFDIPKNLILKLKKKIKSNRPLSKTELNNLRDLGVLFPSSTSKTAARKILQLADKFESLKGSAEGAKELKKVKGVRRKVSMKDKRSEPSKSPPKAKIEKGLGRTLTEREKQYLKSDSDLNPKNFYKGGVVDIVDAGKYFKHKSKR